MNDVMVTVICLSYNHEKYIRQCLDSVLSQVTNFTYEVIVHDDASTDGTEGIIREFEEKHDNLISIIEEENCFQRGEDYSEKIYRKVSGKYIAYCECDDWWCDENKLQRQFEYMESNPGCSLCVHAVKQFCDASDTYMTPSSRGEVEADFSTEEIIRGDGGMFGTNSMFFRSEYYLLPSLYRGWGVGDYPSMIYLSLMGRVHYFPTLMSAYRVFAEGSWSERMKDGKKAEKQERLISDGLTRFDECTDYEYHDAVQYRKACGHLEQIARYGSYRDLKLPASKEYLRLVSRSKQLKYWLRLCVPNLYAVLKKSINDCRNAPL